MAKKTVTKTALAARPTIAELVPNLPMVEQIDRVLGDHVQLGQLGLVEVTLTPEEEAVLSEPIPIDELRVKPQKNPIIYLSHPSYSRWLTRAFGRTGWALVASQKPLTNGTSVVCHYILYIHGKPVQAAWGEQEYHENNAEQTYGDALESTVASALRRCCKHLGIGLELWDKEFLDAYVADHCVCATVTAKDGKDYRQWRRKVDRPFWNEKGGGRRESPQERRPPVHEAEVVSERQQAPAAAQASPRPSGRVITEKQHGRFKVIFRNSGRSDDEVKAWLLSKGFASSRDITMDAYDEVCQAVEGTGVLR